MSKVFVTIFSLSSVLGGFAKSTLRGPELITFVLGYALTGILFGILFGWIWTKTKSKFIKTIIVILSVIFVGKDLGNVQSLIKKTSFKHAYAKSLRAKENEALSFFNGIFLDLKSSFQEAKKINLRVELDKIEKRLNEEDASALTYFKELEILMGLQEKIGGWINDFNKKDVERLYNLLGHTFSILKTASKESPELVEQINIMELLSNSMKDLTRSKEHLEILKKLIELGAKKFITYATKQYSTPERRKQFKKAFAFKNSMEIVLTKLVNTEIFSLMAEEIIQELAKGLQFVDKKTLNFDLDEYMKTKFTQLKETPEGQKQIIKDIMKLKKKFTLLAEAAIKEFC